MPPSATVSIYPILALRAIRGGYRDAWRIWTLARHVDTDGSGRVTAKELRQAALDLGVSLPSYNRFLKKAKDKKIFQPYRHQGKTWYAYISAEKFAACCRCTHVGPRKTSLPISDLFGAGWRARVWDAYNATTLERPISRETMRQITGIPERTQSKYDRELETERIKHYAHDEQTPTDHLHMLKSFTRSEGGRPHAFIYNDKSTGKKLVAWRMPDSRKSHYDQAGKGRAHKVNKALNYLQEQANSLLLERVEFGPVTLPVRLYHASLKHTERAIRHISRKDITAVRQLYTCKPGGRNCQQLAVVHI